MGWTSRFGSAFADTFTTNQGDRTATGITSFAAGGGDDLSVPDDLYAAVSELAGEGFDEVRTNCSSYGPSANVEKVTYTGTGDFIGSGAHVGSDANIILAGAATTRCIGMAEPTPLSASPATMRWPVVQAESLSSSHPALARTSSRTSSRMLTRTL